MTRRDLNDSDLQGLDVTYKKACAERRLAPLEPEEDYDEPPAWWENAANTWGPPLSILALAVLCIWIWGRPWG